MSFTEGTLLSSFEIVLPQNVVETSHKLIKGEGAIFLASNPEKRTTSRIRLHKQSDASVRIKLTVHRWKIIERAPVVEEEDVAQPQNVKIEAVQEWAEEKEMISEPFSLCTDSRTQPQKVKMLESAIASLRRQPRAALNPGGLVTTTTAAVDTDNSNKQNMRTHIQPNGQLSIMDMEGLEPDADSGGEEPLDQEDSAGNLVMAETLEDDSAAVEAARLESGIASELEPTKSDCTRLKEPSPTKAVQRGKRKLSGSKDIPELTDSENPNESSGALTENKPATSEQQKCLFCDLAFQHFSALYIHARNKHSNMEGIDEYLKKIRPFRKCVCTVCDKQYSSKTQLEVHRRTMHVPQRKAKCSACGIIVKSEAHLRRHMCRSHTESKQSFLCHLCPASFKVQSYLADHLRNVHSNNALDTYSCSECDFTCSSRKYLRSHICRVHRGRRYSCPHCQKAFSLAPNMKRHIELVHNKDKTNFTCPECTKNFSLKSNLKEHINSIHLKRFSFKCPLCGAGFRRRRELDTHQQLHNVTLWNGQPAIFLAPLELQNTSAVNDKTTKVPPTALQLAHIIVQSCSEASSTSANKQQDNPEEPKATEASGEQSRVTQSSSADAPELYVTDIVEKDEELEKVQARLITSPK